MGQSESGDAAADESKPVTVGQRGSVLEGHRFVLLFYVGIVALTGVFGYVIGLVRIEDIDPQLFGFVSLPPTPLGMAIYGMVTVGLGLGLFIGAVSYVSSRYDTAGDE